MIVLDKNMNKASFIKLKSKDFFLSVFKNQKPIKKLNC